MECKAELLQRIKSQQVLLSLDLILQSSFSFNIFRLSFNFEECFFQENQSEQLQVAPLSARRCTQEVPEFGGDTWDYDRHQWSKKISGLCTYEWYILLFLWIVYEILQAENVRLCKIQMLNFYCCCMPVYTHAEKFSLSVGNVRSLGIFQKTVWCWHLVNRVQLARHANSYFLIIETITYSLIFLNVAFY